ncbi:hypothetical protein [Lysobacter sp. Hz 25]
MTLKERLRAAEARNPLGYAVGLILSLDGVLVAALLVSEVFP